MKEYTAHFIEKEIFAECYVPTEERRIKRYIWGLKSSLRELVGARRPLTFCEAINEAEMTETEKDRQLGEKGRDKRKWSGPAVDTKKGKSSRLESRGSSRVDDRACKKCNCFHRGECAIDVVGCSNQRACYQCSATDHLRSDCPQLKRGSV